MNETTPTDRACGDCITRRAFVANTTALAAAAAFFAACSEGGSITDPVTPTTIKVGDFANLATVNRLVIVDDFRAVKRTGAATFAAFSRRCTHEGTAVDLSGTGFICNNHLSQFDNDGNVTVSPATQNLTHLTTSYDASTDILTIG